MCIKVNLSTLERPNFTVKLFSINSVEFENIEAGGQNVYISKEEDIHSKVHWNQAKQLCQSKLKSRADCRRQSIDMYTIPKSKRVIKRLCFP